MPIISSDSQQIERPKNKGKRQVGRPVASFVSAQRIRFGGVA